MNFSDSLTWPFLDFDLDFFWLEFFEWRLICAGLPASDCRLCWDICFWSGDKRCLYSIFLPILYIILLFGVRQRDNLGELIESKRELSRELRASNCSSISYDFTLSFWIRWTSRNWGLEGIGAAVLTWSASNCAYCSSYFYQARACSE